MEAVTKEEELSDADSDNGGDQLAAEEVTRLCKGRFDSVELENSARTLALLAPMTPFHPE